MWTQQTEFLNCDDFAKASSCRGVLVDGNETAECNWQDILKTIVQQHLLENPIGIKRTFIYTHLPGNEWTLCLQACAICVILVQILMQYVTNHSCIVNKVSLSVFHCLQVSISVLVTAARIAWNAWNVQTKTFFLDKLHDLCAVLLCLALASLTFTDFW